MNIPDKTTKVTLIIWFSIALLLGFQYLTGGAKMQLSHKGQAKEIKLLKEQVLALREVQRLQSDVIGKLIKHLELTEKERAENEMQSQLEMLETIGKSQKFGSM